LRDLLAGLTDAEWKVPTGAGSWTVHAVVAHLLGGDVGILSRRRDQYFGPGGPIQSHRELVDLVNRLNAEWVTAARRMSPRLLIDLLDFTGPQVESYFNSLDPFALGEPVSWAGPAAAPNWLDLAREFTERWHHQQQIRDAAARPPLYQPYFFKPVLDAFMRAVPHSYRDAAAPAGVLVRITITGESGGEWNVISAGEFWELSLENQAAAAAEITIDQDIAWRLFTKGVTGGEALETSRVSGAASLIQPFFETIAIIG
jgi:uncharacterized protein (TIGR03083 family)